MQIHVNMYVAMQNVDGYFIPRQEASYHLVNYKLYENMCVMFFL